MRYAAAAAATVRIWDTVTPKLKANSLINTVLALLTKSIKARPLKHIDKCTHLIEISLPVFALPKFIF